MARWMSPDPQRCDQHDNSNVAAATTLADRILNQNGAEAYKDYLKAGASDYPLAVIGQAGVDMTQADYLKEAFGVFEKRLDQLTDLLVHK